VSFIDPRLRAGLVGLSLIAGCSSPPVAPSTNEASRASTVDTAGAKPASPRVLLTLPAPGSVRSWSELRMQAARRLVAANPEGSYTGAVVEPLLGVPVLEIELNGDGSVRHIVFLRHAQEARFTSKLAEDAVRRAAPFGDVSRLPKPWRFTETFLFNDERKFKPRSLD
jgi:hypothetical protein